MRRRTVMTTWMTLWYHLLRTVGGPVFCPRMNNNNRRFSLKCCSVEYYWGAPPRYHGRRWSRATCFICSREAISPSLDPSRSVWLGQAATQANIPWTIDQCCTLVLSSVSASLPFHSSHSDSPALVRLKAIVYIIRPSPRVPPSTHITNSYKV